MPDDIRGEEVGAVGDEPAKKEEARDESKWIPKHRFDQVNTELRAYRETELSAADIREMAADYRALVEKELAQQGTPPTAQSKLDDAKRAEYRAGLIDIYPELGGLEELKEDVRRTKATATLTEQQQLVALNDKASAYVAKLFENDGFSLDEQADLCGSVEDVVANAIYNSPDLARRFYRGDLAVVKEVYKRYADSILAHVVKPAKKPTKDLSSFSGKQGLSLPSSSLDDKLKQGKSLTREEMSQLHRETFSLMQSKE
jgi:hypothetical protein